MMTEKQINKKKTTHGRISYDEMHILGTVVWNTRYMGRQKTSSSYRLTRASESYLWTSVKHLHMTVRGVSSGCCRKVSIQK